MVSEPATLGFTFHDAIRQQIADLAHGDLYESITFLEVFKDVQKALEIFDRFVNATLSKNLPLAGLL